MNSKMDSEMEDEDVYVAQKYVGQIMPFHESFEQVNAEVGMKLGTTNILCERVLEVLKRAEKALTNLDFRFLSQHTMAKFNKVSANLPITVPA